MRSTPRQLAAERIVRAERAISQAREYLACAVNDAARTYGEQRLRLAQSEHVEALDALAALPREESAA